METRNSINIVDKNSNIKELFHILWNYLNKNIKEWCYFADQFHWENSNELQINKIVNVWKEYQWNRFVYYLSDYSDWTYLHSMFISNLLNERESYRKNNKNEWEKRYIILWSFPTNDTIFKFIDDNVWLWSKYRSNISYIEYYFRDINTELKELIDMDDETLKKVVLLLKNIIELKNNNLIE
jgi:hypothetical protein